MDTKIVEKKVIALVASQLKKDPKTVTADKELKEDLRADSLDIIEMLINLEEEYGISIPDEELLNLKTIKDIVDFIVKNMK
ncbi:MAG: acyl carrier protein [Christensenellaceae bacterium]|jgi:acyl carrier protein|nr:acyl carrier protein [Christensenellaceae bacterium]